MSYLHHCNSLEEAKKEVQKLEEYYTMRLSECRSHKQELNESNVSEELKDRLNAGWNVRINDISDFLLILKYGWS